MRSLIFFVSCIASCINFPANAGELRLRPGLYQIEVRIHLPNVQDAMPPTIVNRCVSTVELESGRAFFVLSDNPLKQCELLDYAVTASTAGYRIACAGPNRGSAFALFTTTDNGYRGIIKMNMGGKNMTMSETQVGKRIGECR